MLIKNNQNIYKELGSLNFLDRIIKKYAASKILIVTGKKSFANCGAKGILKSLLVNFDVIYFSDFETNPKLEDAKKGAKLINDNNIDLLISIGGGSVIDMAKLMKSFHADIDNASSIVKGELNLIESDIPLIAIPTTAGSGSESTHFAVVYIDKEKYSVASQSLLPNDVILDGSLAISATKYQKACNVLDAISQSIESAWAVSSTNESQKLSYSALKLCIQSFDDYINSDNTLNAAQSMIDASNIAGQAINISKTTAAHAWSYGISMHHNIPHGHAVWFTLPKIFEIHNSESGIKTNDPRGRKYLRDTMKNLVNILEIPNGTKPTEFFKHMLSSIGINADLINDLKLSSIERKRLSYAINLERMANNPIKYSQKNIDYIFEINKKNK